MRRAGQLDARAKRYSLGTTPLGVPEARKLLASLMRGQNSTPLAPHPLVCRKPANCSRRRLPVRVRLRASLLARDALFIPFAFARARRKGWLPPPVRAGAGKSDPLPSGCEGLSRDRFHLHRQLHSIPSPRSFQLLEELLHLGWVLTENSVFDFRFSPRGLTILNSFGYFPVLHINGLATYFP